MNYAVDLAVRWYSDLNDENGERLIRRCSIDLRMRGKDVGLFWILFCVNFCFVELG